MGNKEMNLIVKIIGIIGAVFCGISLIVPWAGWGPFGLYTWGSSALGQWDFFFITTMSSGVIESIVAGVCLIIAFVLTIIALILGIVGFKNVSIKKSNSFLTAGILSIVAIILCVVAVSQFSGNIPGFGLGYGAGFFLIIIAMILYFVSFGFQKVFVPAPTTAATQPMYQQQPMQTQAPAQYYTQQPAPPSPPPMSAAVEQPPPITPPPATSKQAQPQEDAIFCAQCGTKLEPGVLFCPECGAKRG